MVENVNPASETTKAMTISEALNQLKNPQIIIKERNNGGWFGSKFVTIAMVILAVAVFSIAAKVFAERDKVIKELRVEIQTADKEMAKEHNDETKRVWEVIGENTSSIHRIEQVKANTIELITLKEIAINSMGKFEKALDKLEKSINDVVKGQNELANRMTKVEVQMENQAEEMKRLREYRNNKTLGLLPNPKGIESY